MHLSKKILEDSTTTPFMTKSLRKTIICRSKFKNIYSETRSNEYWDNYKKSKNFCVGIFRNIETIFQ